MSPPYAKSPVETVSLASFVSVPSTEADAAFDIVALVGTPATSTSNSNVTILPFFISCSNVTFNPLDNVELFVINPVAKVSSTSTFMFPSGAISCK